MINTKTPQKQALLWEPQLIRKSSRNSNLHRNHTTNPWGSNVRAAVAWVVQLNQTQLEPIRFGQRRPGIEDDWRKQRMLKNGIEKWWGSTNVVIFKPSKSSVSPHDAVQNHLGFGQTKLINCIGSLTYTDVLWGRWHVLTMNCSYVCFTFDLRFLPNQEGKCSTSW